MDFESIVEGLLVEADGATQSATNATNKVNNSKAGDNEEIQGLSEFIKNKYNSIQDAWTKKQWTKTYPLRPIANIDQLSYDVIYGVKGTVKNVDNFDDIANIFPLIDLTAQLYENNYKKGQPKKGADATLKTFLTNFNKLTLTRPFDYIPNHPWAKTLKEAAFVASKNELGKSRVQNLPGGLGIYGTIRELMKIRKKGMLPKLTNFAKNFNGEGILKDIMFKPWKIVNGKYAINDDKIKSLYDAVTVQELVNLSLAAYNLYTQQAQTALSEQADAMLKDEGMYSKFMGADVNALPIMWKPPSEQEGQSATPAGSSQAVNASFDQSFELLSKQMLNEAGSTVGYSPTFANNYDDIFNKKTSTEKNDQSKETDKKETPEESKQLQAFETNKEGEYLYSLDSIKKASAAPFKHPEATELLKHFESLANYIKTKENRDIVGGLTQLAKGLSLGVKNMGT